MEDPRKGQSRSGYEHDVRKHLAVHPTDAGRVFQSQSAYGNNLSTDFRTNVKSLSQIYEAIQRYLQGIYRRDDVFYPELEDVAKDLMIFKRSVNDKIPMPSNEELTRLCLILAAQDPPFLHVLRDMRMSKNGQINFQTHYVAPTTKHEDKILVGYRSVLDTSLKELHSILGDDKFGTDYSKAFARVNSLSDLPLHEGRADYIFKRIYINESQLGSLKESDIKNLKVVNQEIFRRCYRSLLLQAVKDQMLLNFSMDAVRKAGFPGCEKVFDIVLFRVKRDLINRYAALLNFLNIKYAGNLLDEALVQDLKYKHKQNEISEHEMFQAIARSLYDNAIQMTEPDLVAIQFSQEVKCLGEWLHRNDTEQARNSEDDELRKTLRKIREHGGLLRARSAGRWIIPEKFIILMLRGKFGPILACTDPYENLEKRKGNINLDEYQHIYVMYKDRKITGKAIDTAIGLFEKNSDMYTLHVLENILEIGVKKDEQLKEYVAPAYLDRLRHTLSIAYLQYLPWWHRIWLIITSSRLKPEAVHRIRKEKQIEQSRKMQHKRGGPELEAQASHAARKKVKEVARKRVAENNLNDSELNLLEELKIYLDNEWQKGKYPTAREIFASAGSHEKEYRKLMGLVDVGAASVNEVVQIPSSVETVYGHRTFLVEHRQDLLEYLGQKIKNSEATIVHQNRSMTLAREDNNQQKEIIKAIYDFIRLRLG